MARECRRNKLIISLCLLLSGENESPWGIRDFMVGMEGSWLRKGGVLDGRCVATVSERRAGKHVEGEHLSVGATMDVTAQQKQIPLSREKQTWRGEVSVASDWLCQRSSQQSETDGRGHTERSAQTHAGSSVVEKLQAETPILDFSFTKGLHIMHLNVRSLLSKLDELRLICLQL